MASSSSVYGANPTLPKHEDLATRPLSPYAASKLATEAYALAWQQTYDMPVLALRFFNVFGPLQAAGHAYAAVIPAFVDAALRGVPLPVHGDGTQGRDFTYVDTVTEVLAGAAVDGVDHPTPVNLAFGTRTDLLHLIELLEEILGRPLERDHQPTRVGDVKQSQADSSVLHVAVPRPQPRRSRDRPATHGRVVPVPVVNGPYRGKRVVDLLLLALVAVPALSSWPCPAPSPSGSPRPGPILFRQERIGRDGRPFSLLKFRTMTTGRNALIPDQADITARRRRAAPPVAGRAAPADQRRSGAR